MFTICKAQGIAIDESITTVEEAREAILTLWRNKTKRGDRKMLRELTLGQYYPADSIVHRLDPRTKLFATMVFIASLLLQIISGDI